MTAHADPSTLPRDAPRERLVELDGLRGLSALAVCLFHYTWFVRFVVPGIRVPPLGAWWGCYGVQVFFAVSGFVILGTLGRTRSLADFARARALRLFPEYWAAMAITAGTLALLGTTGLRVSTADWLRNLPMLQLWTGTPMVDGVYWTLNIELAFYAGMALVWRLGGTRRIEAVVLGWLAIKWLASISPVDDRLRLVLLTEQAAYFSVGLVAYRVWSGERRWTDQMPVMAAIGLTVFALDPIHAHWLFLGMAPLFLALARGRMHWLAHPVLARMGWLSYPFYLLHAAIGYAVIGRLETLGAGPVPSAAAAFAVSGMLAAALAILGDRMRSLARRIRRATPATARLSGSAVA